VNLGDGLRRWRRHQTERRLPSLVVPKGKKLGVVLRFEVQIQLVSLDYFFLTHTIRVVTIQIQRQIIPHLRKTTTDSNQNRVETTRSKYYSVLLAIQPTGFRNSGYFTQIIARSTKPIYAKTLTACPSPIASAVKPSAKLPIGNNPIIST